jgi:hypothetical protein
MALAAVAAVPFDPGEIGVYLKEGCITAFCNVPLLYSQESQPFCKGAGQRPVGLCLIYVV